MVKRGLYSALLIALVLAAASCGKSDVKKASGQVVAKVNGEEISVHQINNAIARSNDIAPDEAKQAAAQTLERIIDQELLVQRALKDKLDRDPQVMQAIQEAKRQILARAYIDKTAAAATTQSWEEIRKFYQDNPALFGRRRIYRVHELVVVAPQEKLAALKAAAAGAKSMQELAGWLKSHSLAFQAVTSHRPAEQIPANILAQLFEMREAQIAVVPTPRGASVVQLLEAQEAPLSEAQAAPVIERYLQSRTRLALAQAEVKKLREHAGIEYVGEFEAPRAQPTSSGATPSGSIDHHDESIRKGLAGLR